MFGIRMVRMLLPALLLASAVTASAQVKVAIINLQKAVLETAEIQKAQKELEAKFKPRQDKAEALQRELQTIQGQLQTMAGKLTPQAWWRIRSSHQIVWWHALAWDWDARLSPEACYERLQWGLAPGRIAVLHDSIKAKDRVLPLLRKLLHEWEDKDWHSQVISK